MQNENGETRRVIYHLTRSGGNEGNRTLILRVQTERTPVVLRPQWAPPPGLEPGSVVLEATLQPLLGDK